jgi:hypothetical protein
MPIRISAARSHRRPESACKPSRCRINPVPSMSWRTTERVAASDGSVMLHRHSSTGHCACVVCDPRLVGRQIWGSAAFCGRPACQRHTSADTQDRVASSSESSLVASGGNRSPRVPLIGARPGHNRRSECERAVNMANIYVTHMSERVEHSWRCTRWLTWLYLEVHLGSRVGSCFPRQLSGARAAVRVVVIS